MKRLRMIWWAILGIESWEPLGQEEMEQIVQDTFNRRMKGVMKEMFESGFSAGAVWVLDDLLSKSFIEHIPELQQWARDARSLISEHNTMDGP